MKRILFKKRTFERHRWSAIKVVRVVFSLLDAVVTWFATIVMVIFPVGMFLGTFLIPYCF